MGMYTEIYVNVNLRVGIPESVLGVLRAMCGTGDQSALVGHPGRWGLLFNNGSYYTPLTECKSLTFDKIHNGWSLLGKGDIKNYEHEIEDFFAWLMPHIEGDDGDFVGYYRYEENQQPTLVFLKHQEAPLIEREVPKTTAPATATGVQK